VGPDHQGLPADQSRDVKPAARVPADQPGYYTSESACPFGQEKTSFFSFFLLVSFHFIKTAIFIG
jgi:hypothetical protein